ncbi:hypothetical protein Tco_1491227 [Tanacetum coccineum]
MVAYLQKSEGSEGFHQIVDFLTASHISTLENRDMEITATIDGKVKVVSKASIRRHLKLEDSDGISALPTTEIFEQLALMGSKKTAWEQFSSNIATAINCLATNRNFNFSKLIFDGMGKGSTIPVESHHIPIVAPSTSQPHHSPTLKDFIRHETEVPQPSSPTQTHVADEAASTGVDVRHEGDATTGRKIAQIDEDEGITLVQMGAQTQGSMIKLIKWKLILSLPLADEAASTGVDVRHGGAATNGRKIAQIDEDEGITLHMGSYTLQQLRGYSFDEIKVLFEATMKRVNTFTLIESDDTVPKVLAGSSKRSAEEELGEESSKGQKIGEGSQPAEESKDKESDELSQKQLQQLKNILEDHQSPSASLLRGLQAVVFVSYVNKRRDSINLSLHFELSVQVWIRLWALVGIVKVAISGIRCGVCRQSGEERGTMLGVNLAGSGDRVLKKMYSVPGSNLKFGKWQERPLKVYRCMAFDKCTDKSKYSQNQANTDTRFRRVQKEAKEAKPHPNP